MGYAVSNEELLTAIAALGGTDVLFRDGYAEFWVTNHYCIMLLPVTKERISHMAIQLKGKT